MTAIALPVKNFKLKPMSENCSQNYSRHSHSKRNRGYYIQNLELLNVWQDDNNLNRIILISFIYIPHN
jgi:hypothetical protein